MRRVKRFLSAILAMTMVLAMSMTVFAADVTINEGTEDGSTYSAYKLLNATVSETTGDDGETVENISYTVNDKYTSVLQEATGKESQADIIASIANCNDASIRAFADTAYGEIKEANLGAEATTSTCKFTELEAGYYLVVETVAGDNDTYSLVMLDTAGNDNITITTKESVPELVKKVKEKDDTAGTTTDWQDAADYDIGDDVPFQLTGTVPSKYDSYKTYYYAFHDTLSDGLTFNNDVVVKVDGTKITEGYTVVTSDLDDGCSFEVRFDNLKNIAAVKADSVITVDYTAELNSDAVIGKEGNPNVAKLEFSNNPYYEKDTTDSDPSPEDTSETPEDKVIVFTYKLTVEKVDGNDKALKGAGFTLYKYDADKADYVAVGTEVKGGDITTFEFKGLDAGTYKLQESTVPAGYNQAADIEFVIKATYDTEADAPALKTFTVTDKAGAVIKDTEGKSVFNAADGLISTKVKNVSGAVLPSTGGIGTTIFYIVGAILMIGAVVLLVKNKRAAN